MNSEPRRIADRVYALLKDANSIADLGWVFPRGTSFRCFSTDAARVELPDAAFISFARTPTVVYEEGHCQCVPDLVVEVVAPDDLAVAHTAKVAAWLDAGVQPVWELFPTTRTMYMMRPDGRGLRLRSGDTLTAPDVLPGFSLHVADIFRLPGQPAAPAAAPVP